MANEKIRSGADRPALVVGLLLLAVAGLVARDAASQTIVSNYGVGPTAMPYVVAGGLALLGLAHLIVAFREGLPAPDTSDPRALGWIVAGLAGFIACVALGGGFVIATAMLFAFTARGFGREALAVDLAIGFAMGLVIYVLFFKLLTLSLPAGPLERLLV
ncbi:MAG: tripartite tricarboxylate transporter TctB family protein [Bosea sp. (in: a-proteobacteria)]